jgi:hypothetical protein
MGADISGEIQEAKDITAKFLAVFTKHYSKCYLIALMQISKKQLAKEARGNPWKLMKCDKTPAQPVVKTGMVHKLSKYLKKWNPRFVVVKGDYLIDYYETEDKYNAKAKPLGSINMSNKNLHRDANDTIINRLIALAEKCKINMDDMPKPEKYPDYTLEIWHERKGPIYLQCPNAEEWKHWCDVIDKCRWMAPRYDEYQDRANVFAFPMALWRTRWECDMWGWWSGGGGESAMLVDAINDKVADVVMSKLDAKLTMPWAARSRIRNKFTTTVDGFVTTAVGPAWSAAYSAVKKVRPDVEAKIKEMMQPIVDAQKQIQDEIIGMVEKNSKDFLNEKVTPHLTPLIEIVFAPVTDGFRILLKAYDVAIEKGKAKYETTEERTYMVNHYSYNSEYWDAERKMWDLYDPLWEMRRVFDDIYPWNITGRARRRLRKTLNNALFTFEHIFEDGKATGKTYDEAAAEARLLMVQDCRTAIQRVLGKILFGCVENFYEKLVIRTARKLVAPLAEKVPQAIKDFVDPEQLLEELLYNILRSCCGTVFEPFISRIDL